MILFVFNVCIVLENVIFKFWDILKVMMLGNESIVIVNDFLGWKFVNLKCF